ncbi:MAG: hypothetical protein P4N60_10555 [Verrucomicrobiae bacterium]|nr:hypothetical protein [Verrucomicrobiae bacterium]
MKRTLVILCLNAVILAAGLPSASAKDAPTSAEQLRSELESAIKAKDRNALKSLFNEHGLSAEMKSIDDETFNDLVKPDSNIKSVKLSPLPADFHATNELNGVRYVPNVSVVGMVDVQFAEEGNSLQLPYGQKDGAFYMAGTTEEKTGAPFVKEKSIGVLIMGLSTPAPVTFTGSCVYLQNGKETTEDLSGDKGNLSKAFWGDYVKSCTVKKTSDQGWLKLKITEDNQTIFESQKITNQEPVVYLKK